MNTQPLSDAKQSSIPAPASARRDSPEFDYVAHIPRASIRGINDMRVDGAVRDLGEVKNFRNDEYLRRHLPSNVSTSWTHLGPHQVLEPHVHPVPSMIIVTRGRGRSIGDTQVEFRGGDVIYVPAYNSHGFVGLDEGFWALSVQFERVAIFETETDPLTRYLGDSRDREERAEPLRIISRGDLPSIHEVQIGSRTHDLGIVKNFRSNEHLRDLLPSNLSLAWVRLEDRQQLHAHRHAESSMIIVTEGRGRFLGERLHALEEGDIVFVPEFHVHGFRGGRGGFWGLSVQFGDASLYERPEQPRVLFDSCAGTLSHLLERNDRFAEHFCDHEVFDCIHQDLLQDPHTRARFLSGLSIWSAYFQRIMMARCAFTNPGPSADMFYQHLVEELGHDKDLEAVSDGAQVGFDPALEGMCSWFVYQTLALDNAERIVMANLVLERAGREFYERYSTYLGQFGIDKHFEEHVEHDEQHETMGLELLGGLTREQYARLEKIQEDSWKMLGGILTRVKAIALGMNADADAELHAAQ